MIPAAIMFVVVLLKVLARHIKSVARKLGCTREQELVVDF
jgi:hypothetical protein